MVVDTSALMAILKEEPEAEACITAIETAGKIFISAGTVTEALIVSSKKGVRRKMEDLLGGLNVEIIPVTAASARLAADAYDRWGKGVHPARLNLGDCFAYALARERNCPLLFVGSDFGQTDIAAVLA